MPTELWKSVASGEVNCRTQSWTLPFHPRRYCPNHLPFMLSGGAPLMRKAVEAVAWMGEAGSFHALLDSSQRGFALGPLSMKNDRPSF